jgi:hypothetical protein
MNSETCPMTSPGFKRHYSHGHSLEREEFSDEMQAVDPSPKRMRHSFVCASSSVVSVATKQDVHDCDVDSGEETYYLSQFATLGEVETPVLEWWREKVPSSKSLLGISSVEPHPQSADCFVCCQPLTSEPMNQSPRTVMRENALLAYLTTTRTMSQQNHQQKVVCDRRQQLVRQASDKALVACLAATPEVCSFCERLACFSCTATCEGCEKTFCSFCTTTDYSQTVSRTVCLDCNRQFPDESSQYDDDDMHIG